MNNYYIINNFVKFCPVSNRLSKISDETIFVTLNAPASRCFLMLIKQQGKIISQQEFMDEVWQKKGIIVGANTYYQNISILRKSLKNIGLNYDVVITIPRVGLTLAKGINIKSSPADPDTLRSSEGRTFEKNSTFPATDSASSKENSIASQLQYFEKLLTACHNSHPPVQFNNSERTDPSQASRNNKSDRSFSPFSTLCLSNFFQRYKLLTLFALLLVLAASTVLRVNVPSEEDPGAVSDQKSECSGALPINDG